MKPKLLLLLSSMAVLASLLGSSWPDGL